MLALIALLTVILAFFGYVAVRSFAYAASQSRQANTQRLSLALGFVCVTFVLIGIQAWLHQAVRVGWLPDSLHDWLFDWGTLIIGLIALALAGVCLWLVSNVFSRVQRQERLVQVMITSPLVDVKVSELSLTARELQILEFMAEGRMSDDEIAEAFFIAPTTAATHVKNMLRKADVHNRRDLVLFYTLAKMETQP